MSKSIRKRKAQLDSLRCFIVWQGEDRSCSGYIIPTNYDRSVLGFRVLAKAARTFFMNQNISDSVIECLVVARSSRFQGMPAIRFPLSAGTTHPSFEQVEGHLNDIQFA